MDTIEVKLVKMNDGRTCFLYPETPVLWNMEGAYMQSEDHSTLIKLTSEQVDLLVPKE